MTRPNILYLHAHDCGRFVGPNGYDMPTPNLMRLAREGTVFRQACCAAPSCSPSRAALLTGQYPHVNGMMGLAWYYDGFSITDYRHHLVSFLNEQGFTTALAGSHHVSKHPKTEVGYKRVIGGIPSEQLAGEVDAGVTLDLSTEDAVAGFLQEQHDQPFFLAVGFGEPHRNSKNRVLFSRDAEEVAADDEDAKYVRPLPPFPDGPVGRAEAANFRVGVGRMDDRMGTILDLLDASPYGGNTLVIATTDHGVGFPGMKCTLTDWGIGVFLIMRGPGVPKGAVLDSLVSQVDIYPTIADCLGVDPPEWLQGKSLLPLLRGDRDEVNEAIFAEQGYHCFPRPLRAVRTSRYKLIRSFLPEATEAHFCTDGGPTYELLMEHGLRERTVPEYALYDLVFDPMERCNQAGNPAYAEVLEELKARLDRYMHDTDDPLLQGVLPPSPQQLAKQAEGS